ncbi:MAG: hypothetical protein LQ342_000154 [Letrouitia transgressa]|nr:MAG: hypothetical protein LQ342_000154 [Letrouitia transgressa]
MVHMAKRDLSSVNWQNSLAGTSLDAAGLIALADLDTIARRTALLGSASFTDALVICPGIHRQQKASDLSKAELPPTGSLTNGYIFRIENQATVAYLQSIGITGQLVTLGVEKLQKRSWYHLWAHLIGPGKSLVSFALILVAILSTIGSVTLLILIEDWWGVSILFTLIVARFLNISLIRWRTMPNWHGVLEPGMNGDLLVLLSQDRWVRMQGSVDALKAVTSGRWLSDMTFLERSLEAIATVLVYLSAVLASNATQSGKMLLIILLLGSVGLLGISNQQQEALYMRGHIVRLKGKPKMYARRLDLAKELIKETKRHDWAVGLGMVKGEEYGERSAPVTL